MTDSEQVPWGKGEKYSWQEGEIVPETVCLQTVGATFAELALRKGWLRAFCLMNQRVARIMQG